VPRRWGRHIFSDTVATRLLAPRHGDALVALDKLVVATSICRASAGF
jgi:hypothetical protein